MKHDNEQPWRWKKRSFNCAWSVLVQDRETSRGSSKSSVGKVCFYSVWNIILWDKLSFYFWSGYFEIAILFYTWTPPIVKYPKYQWRSQLLEQNAGFLFTAFTLFFKAGLASLMGFPAFSSVICFANSKLESVLLKHQEFDNSFSISMNISSSL